MKKLLVLGVATCSYLSAHAQGTVLFANYGGPMLSYVNAPVYQADAVTLLTGPQFMAELLGGPSSTSLASIATTGFLTGALAGYFDGGIATINSVAPVQTAWVQVDVWNTALGATFNQAKASGLPNAWWQSSVFSVVTQGGFQSGPPPPLTGLGTSPLYLNGVPEPSIFALVAIGMISLLLRFRQKVLKVATGLAVVVCSCRYAHAQGTVQFINIGVGFDAPVYQSDGVTPLSGPQYQAELLGGTSPANLASVATTGFLTGSGYAGYFNGGVATINGIDTFQTAWVQVDVWNTALGATFDQAKASGLPNSWWQSAKFTVSVGGPGFNGGPPPAMLTGLGNSPGYLNGVPEPSTLALVGLAAVVVLLRFKRP